MPDITAFLIGIPVIAVYLVIGLVIGVESMGVPLPGETMLLAATIIAAQPGSPLNPVWIAVSAATGAIIGDTLGYAIGRRFGGRLFDVLGRRFPRHASPAHIAYTRHLFSRLGVWAVFFGRFIALLRILAGPIAGMMHMPYRRFLLANASGGIVWAGGTVAVVYSLGLAAEHWLQRGAWVALVLMLTVALVCGRYFAARVHARVREYAALHGIPAPPD